jgi:hypothetical protein
MLFVGADGLYYPLVFAVTLVTRHAKGGERHIFRLIYWKCREKDVILWVKEVDKYIIFHTHLVRQWILFMFISNRI